MVNFPCATGSSSLSGAGQYPCAGVRSLARSGRRLGTTPTLGQGGNQAVEDAVVLAHHSRDLPAYTADRLPRTTAIARQAVRLARLNMAGNRAVAAVRNTAVAALSPAGPALLLRGFDGIADRRPPYASGREHAGKP